MDDSRFGQLPGELRNQIYSLALREDDGIPLYGDATGSWHHHTGDRRFSATTTKPPPYTDIAAFGLPNACRATRDETMRLYFRLNGLVLHCDDACDDAAAAAAGRSPVVDPPALMKAVRQLRRWCGVIGRERTRELRRVTFDLGEHRAAKVGFVVSLLTEQLGGLRKLFHPAATFEVRWMEQGLLPAPVCIVLGDRVESLRRLRDSTREMGLDRCGWAMWKECEENVRRVVGTMHAVS